MKRRFFKSWLCGLITIFTMLFVIGCVAEDETGFTNLSTETVADTQAPTITPKDLTVEYGATLNYSDLATVEDDSSEDIELSVTPHDEVGITIDEESRTIVLGAVGSFDIELSATDEAGNKGTGKVLVVVKDSVQPTLTLSKTAFSLTAGDAAPDYAGIATASDNVDGDLTAAISVDTSKVNLNSAGTYEVTYTVTDGSGNETVQTATVLVAAKPQPAPKQNTISESSDSQVMITRTGECYHRRKCGNGNYFWASLSEAKARGLRPCQKCY